jgi:hypothetical protein
MPRKNPKIRKIKRADETRAWVIGLVSQAPKAFGVRARRAEGEYWSLGVLREYVKKHGAALGYFAGEKRLRAWISAPELRGNCRSGSLVPRGLECRFSRSVSDGGGACSWLCDSAEGILR